MENMEFTSMDQIDDISTIDEYQVALRAGCSEKEALDAASAFSRDNARTPVQWSAEKNAGFSEGEPWLGVNPNYKEINAKQQLSDPNSIFHYYQKLIALRKEKEIIVYGEFEPLCREDDQIFAYMRKLDEERLLTVCNFSEHVAEMEIPEEFQKNAECLITNLGRKDFGKKVVLKPYEAFVLYRNL